MRSVVLKSQFRRDYRKWIEGMAVEGELRAVMDRIATGVTLEPRHRDHPLSGEWQGCRDCHVRGDLVLIYSIPPGLAVFHRVGSHSELFRR
jgi:mRNA interferase YafQ